MVEPRKISAARCQVTQIQEPSSQWFVDYLPITGGNTVDLYVDGIGYGKDLLSALNGASKQILLTGLHFDPDWALERSTGDNQAKSLLSVLENIAKKGSVEIYLIVNQFWKNEVTPWDPVRQAIKHSAHLDWYMPKTIKLFDGLKKYKNVHCRTDVHAGFVMSTHHQKTVIIDEKVCFLGGIDMTAVDGDRWDEPAHKIGASAKSDKRKVSLPERLWHDVHCKITGPAVQFVLDNFHARWNHGHLYSNPRIYTRHFYLQHKGVKYPRSETVFEVTPDIKNRHMFARIQDAGGVYQGLTKKSSSSYVDSRGQSKVSTICGHKTLAQLDGTKVQIVRSMPYGRYKYGAQKPAWNLSASFWERACKDAYLVGIRAAKKYIYLENQWISDEAIWKELKLAAERNKNNPNFRIVVMIPRKPLSAAGYGTNQDVNIEAEIKAVIKAFNAANQFGMYCLVSEIPKSRRKDIDLTDEDKYSDGSTWSQIYVHSKVMIVDDKWSLIGSANAGGISLEGMSNPAAPYRGATPDTEISTIIYDEAFAKKFRETLWAEHLEDPGVAGQEVHTVADIFRQHAADKSKIQRVQFARDYGAMVGRGHTFVRHIPANIISAVRKASAIESSRNDKLLILDPGDSTVFAVKYLHPGPAYKIKMRWSLRDPDNKAWFVRGVNDDTIPQAYGDVDAVYLPQKTKQALREKYQGKEQVRVRLLCRVMVLPAGVKTRQSGDDDDNYSFLLEVPLIMVFSGHDYKQSLKDKLIFNSTMQICHRLLKSRVFKVTRDSIKVTVSTRWDGPSGCGGATFPMNLNKNNLIFDDELEKKVFTVGQNSQTWDGLEEGEYYLTIWPDNTNPHCCLVGDIEVTELF